MSYTEWLRYRSSINLLALIHYNILKAYKKKYREFPRGPESCAKFIITDCKSISDNLYYIITFLFVPFFHCRLTLDSFLSMFTLMLTRRSENENRSVQNFSSSFFQAVFLRFEDIQINFFCVFGYF